MIYCLGKIGDRSAMPALIDAWDKSDDKGKERMITAFGTIRDLRGVNTLIQAIASPNKRWHWMANEYLRNILDGCDSVGEVNQFIRELEAAFDNPPSLGKDPDTLRSRNVFAGLLSYAMEKRNGFFSNDLTGLEVKLPNPRKKQGMYRLINRKKQLH